MTDKIKIKSKNFSGIYYIVEGKNKTYYCKFRLFNKLYNYRNLSKEFNVRNEAEAFSIMERLKADARDAKRLGLPNPLDRRKITKEVFSKRTINEHWEHELVKYQKNLSKNTVKQYINFYKKYIKLNLGKKFPDEIRTIDIDYILNQTELKDTDDTYRSLLKRLLRPIFAKAMADSEMMISPIEAYKFDMKMIPKRKKISRKTTLTHLDISKKLYKEIPNYIAQYKIQRTEWQQLLYLQLLTGKRYGELFEVTADNIDYKNKRIKLYADMTKTGVEVSFPIPEECQEFILNIKDGKIFKEISIGSYYMVFQRLKENALTKEIREENIELSLKEQKELDNYKKANFELTAHDTRSLFMSTLVSLKEDSRLIDAMLDHKQNNEETVHFYLDLSDDAKNKAYTKYWNALRE